MWVLINLIAFIQQRFWILHSDWSEGSDFVLLNIFNTEGVSSASASWPPKVKCLSVLFFFVFFPSDTNGDGVLDEQELEALFTKEVN